MALSTTRNVNALLTCGKYSAFWSKSLTKVGKHIKYLWNSERVETDQS